MLDGLTVTRDAFPRTIRLVSTARLRDAVLGDLVDNEDELQALAEIEGATSQRLVTQARGSGGVSAEELVHGVPHAHFINASFTYPNPRQPNRFNGCDRGAWYAALSVDTCLQEITFHTTQFLSDAGDFNTIVEFGEMFASFAGEFLDLRATPGHESLNPNPAIGYPVGNALADAVRVEGYNGIIYPSVRHADGTCFAVLFPHGVQSVVQGDVYRLVWSGMPDPIIEKVTWAFDGT